MDNFRADINLEPAGASALLNVLSKFKCIWPDISVCGLCCHYPACKFITDFVKALEEYLNEREEE